MDSLPISEQTRLCIQSTPNRTHSGLRPHSEPIDLTGVWQVDSPDEADALLSGRQPGFVYRRDGHPNADSLSEILRQLHRADHAVLTAQGMSALTAVTMTVLKPGDRVVLGQPVYGRCGILLSKDLARWGITTVEVDATDLKQWESALESRPRLALVETITNPRVEVPDLAKIASMCKATETLMLVDNTFATPLLCRPLELGSDFVMESLSKFVCGHSDAMLGLLCGTDRAWDGIRQTVSTFGLASSPLDCWLTRRGLATLQLRLERACENAVALTQALESHPAVASIDYPGLASHPQRSVAAEQFGGRFGNMFSFRLEGPTTNVEQFIREIQADVPFCPSLGEAQTTLSHPCSTSHRSYSEHRLASLGITFNTVRISTGIEDVQWLIERFTTALDALSN